MKVQLWLTESNGQKVVDDVLTWEFSLELFREILFSETPFNIPSYPLLGNLEAYVHFHEDFTANACCAEFR